MVDYQDAYDHYVPVLENSTYAFASNGDYAPDRYLGFRLRPLDRWINGKRVLKTNSLGLRCPEIDQMARDRDLAVFLGGSTLFGSYAPSDEETIPAFCETFLHERLRCINAGANGHVFTQHVSLFANYLLPYLKPKNVVVLAGYNDFLACCRYNKAYGEIIIDDFQVILHDYPRRPLRTAGKIMAKYAKMKASRVLPTMKPLSVPSASLRFDAQARGRLERYVQIFTQHILSLDALCASMGAQFSFFLQPALVLSSKSKSAFEQNLERTITDTPLLAAFYNALKNRMTGKVSFYDLSDAFAGVNQTVFIDPVHMGDRGNRLLGERIASELKIKDDARTACK